MKSACPYRETTYPLIHEEELWLSLDRALEMSMIDPGYSYKIAWDVWLYAKKFPCVRVASDLLMSELVAINKQIRLI